MNVSECVYVCQTEFNPCKWKRRESKKGVSCHACSSVSPIHDYFYDTEQAHLYAKTERYCRACYIDTNQLLLAGMRSLFEIVSAHKPHRGIYEAWQRGIAQKREWNAVSATRKALLDCFVEATVACKIPLDICDLIVSFIPEGELLSIESVASKRARMTTTVTCLVM